MISILELLRFMCVTVLIFGKVNCYGKQNPYLKLIFLTTYPEFTVNNEPADSQFEASLDQSTESASNVLIDWEVDREGNVYPTGDRNRDNSANLKEEFTE